MQASPSAFKQQQPPALQRWRLLIQEIIHVQCGVVKLSHQESITKDPKTTSGDRMVYLSKEMCRLLKAWWKECERDREQTANCEFGVFCTAAPKIRKSLLIIVTTGFSGFLQCLCTVVVKWWSAFQEKRKAEEKFHPEQWLTTSKFYGGLRLLHPDEEFQGAVLL